MMSLRRWLPWAALAVATAALFGSTAHDELGDIGGDSARYILLAQALASGRGYRDLSDPQARPYLTAPPLFPLMLAPVVAAYGPRAFRPLHLLIIGWALLAVWLTVALLRCLGDGQGAWVAAAACAAHPWVLSALLCIWSEHPYLALSLLALYADQRARSSHPAAHRWLLLAALAAAAATLTRTIGWALLLAGVCAWWPRPGRRSWRPLLVWGSVAISGPLMWALYTVSHPQAGRSTYWRDLWLVDPLQPSSAWLSLETFMERAGAFAQLYVRMLGDMLNGYLWAPLVGGVLVGLVLLGWCVTWRRHGLMNWYVVWYVCALLAHPWYEGPRYLLPLLPLAWHYLWVGGRWCLARVTWSPWSRALQVGIGGGLAILLAGQGVIAAQILMRQHRDVRLPPPAVRAQDPGRPSIQWARMHVAFPPDTAALRLVQWTDHYELMHWIRERLPQQTVILCAKPSIVRLFAERPAVSYPLTTDVAAWRDAAQSFPSVMLLADRYAAHSRRFAWPMVAAHPDWFEPVHTIGTATLFRVVIPQRPVP